MVWEGLWRWGGRWRNLLSRRQSSNNFICHLDDFVGLNYLPFGSPRSGVEPMAYKGHATLPT